MDDAASEEIPYHITYASLNTRQYEALSLVPFKIKAMSTGRM